MIRDLPQCLVLACAALVGATSLARAQGAAMPEPAGYVHAGHEAASIPLTGDDQWNPAIEGFNINGVVFETGLAPNGDLYIGGNFTSVGGVQANRIARWDGTAWHALGTGIPAGFVYAIAFDGANVYVGGNFKGAGDIKASNIARWDGTQWNSLGDITSEGVDSTVLALAIHGTDVYAGGNFVYTGNQDQVNYIARWSATDSSFHALNDGTRAGMDGGIGALLFPTDGNTLYAGGGFTKAGGTTASRIAKWTDGAWNGLGTGLGAQQGFPTPYVTTLTRLDTLIIAGGTFTFAGGHPTKYVARWSPLAQSWGGLAGDGINGTDSAIYRVAVNSSGYVYATGDFANAGGHPAKHIALWRGATIGWSPLGSGLDQAGFALTVDGTKLWVGGEFTQAGTAPSHWLAQWSEESGAGVNENAGATEHAPLNAMRWNGDAGEIRFTLAASGPTTMDIVDMRGNVVATPVAGYLGAGEHAATWNASGLPSGLYICRLRNGADVQSRRIALAR